MLVRGADRSRRRPIPVLGALPPSIDTLQWHGDTFDLPQVRGAAGVLTGLPRTRPSALGSAGVRRAVPRRGNGRLWKRSGLRVPAYAEYADRVLGPGGQRPPAGGIPGERECMQEHARSVFERWCELAERAGKKKKRGGVKRLQLAWSAALRPCQPGLRRAGSASTAPLWESRRKSMPLDARELARPRHRAVGQAHLGADGQVEARLERAVVAERDAEPGVGAQQAALADRDDGRVAAKESVPMIEAPPPTSLPSPINHAGRDAALDHRRPERAGFVNYNAGTLGASMVEGRISAGVVIGDGSDVGGGASIMGTLSGGNTTWSSRSASAACWAPTPGLGIPLGDDCYARVGPLPDRWHSRCACPTARWRGAREAPRASAACSSGATPRAERSRRCRAPEPAGTASTPRSTPTE